MRGLSEVAQLGDAPLPLTRIRAHTHRFRPLSASGARQLGVRPILSQPRGGEGGMSARIIVADDERRRRASELGVFEFLTKPVDFDRLKAQLRQLPAAAG
jgi:hypothetical protein